MSSIKALANSNQVIRLALGNLDLQADLGMICDRQETELQTARYQIVLASRLAQIAPPVDGVTPSTDDIERITDDAERAKRMGFGGKLCIHSASTYRCNPGTGTSRHGGTGSPLRGAFRTIDVG